jgi:hypothetical protein
MVYSAISRCLRFYAGIIIRYVMTPALPGTDRQGTPVLANGARECAPGANVNL